eukprot:12436474-Alexandrium_andersonii.AAC.1
MPLRRHRSRCWRRDATGVELPFNQPEFVKYHHLDVWMDSNMEPHVVPRGWADPAPAPPRASIRPGVFDRRRAPDQHDRSLPRDPHAQARQQKR